MNGRWWLVLLGTTLVLVAIAHGPGLQGQFVFDDIGEVRDNRALRTLWPPTVAMFEGGRLPHRPLAYYTFALTRSLNEACGLAGDDVRGYHVFSLAVHLANGLLLWWLIARSLTWFCGWSDERRVCLVGWASATLWLVHPLVTQPVTYIYQRMELLGALAILGCLAAFAMAMRPTPAARPRVGWLAAAVGAAWLGAGCKETVAAAPLLVALYDWAVVGTPGRRMLARWPLYLALACTWVVLAAVVVSQKARYPELNTDRVLWWEYALNQPTVMLRYLQLAVWPVGLCFDYGWPVERRLLPLLPGLAVVSGLLIATAATLRWNRPLGFLPAAFFLTLAPTSSLLPVTDLCVEHRMYLPLACLVTLAVLAVDRVSSGPWSWPTDASRLVMLVGLAGGAAALTAERATIFRSRSGLWQATSLAAPANSRAVAALAEARYRVGDVPGALAAYERSIALEPRAAVPHAGRAACLLKLERFADAVAAAEQAVSLQPDHAPAYSIMAESLLRLGQIDAAVTACERAFELDPTNPATRRTRREISQRRGVQPDASDASRLNRREPPPCAELHVASTKGCSLCS